MSLLDEAAELLGDDDRTVQARARRERRRRIAYARGVLDLAYGSRSVDLNPEEEAEVLSAYDILDAERLANRYEEDDDRTAVERAAADRTWAFGHIVVDEAQELSPMAWRMLMRRCPTRSMTIVGDMAQASELGGGSVVAGGARTQPGRPLPAGTPDHQLPHPSRVRGGSCRRAGGHQSRTPPPRPVRETGVEPWQAQAPPGELGGLLGELAREESAAIGAGRLAVIVPTGRVDELTRAVGVAVPDVVLEDPSLDRPVVVLSVKQVRGLEFDSVLVAEAGRIVADSPSGLNDLYVAITHATQGLGVIHEGDLPQSLSHLTPRPPPLPKPLNKLQEPQPH